MTSQATARDQASLVAAATTALRELSNVEKLKLQSVDPTAYDDECPDHQISYADWYAGIPVEELDAYFDEYTYCASLISRIADRTEAHKLTAKLATFSAPAHPIGV